MSSEFVWFLVGAATSAALILFVIRRHVGGDGAVHRSLGEFGELLNGVRRQQEQLATQATQWNQLLGRASDRGRWGELTLQRIVESAGLQERLDFDVQVHASDDDRNGRPDLVLQLAGGGCLPIDSKAVWDHYQASLAESDPEARKAHVARHARDVRACVQTLGAKAYWKLLPRAPEVVVLFMPSEAAFAAAAEADPELLGYAIDRRVVITTPSTLYALLQVVAVGWQQAELAQNAEEIRTLGAQLIKRLSSVSDELSKASRGLNSAVRAHNEVVSAFDGKVLSTARRMGELGVGGASELTAPTSVEVTVRMPQLEREPEAPDGILHPS
ncbi:MAG: DNA recombination protein RmuC [Solirubrobacterales bacterium]